MRPRLRISTGQLEGVGERDVLAFRGIPYAAPPLGPLRFAAPERATPWSGIRDAAQSGPAPLQNPGAMLGGRPIAASSEDCLYLDVYTPSLIGARPVMLWLFGGGFVAGSGSDVLTQGHRLALHGDVVVVTCNYRLGAFGFLTPLPDSDAVPNAGLLDQIAVLKWIHEEIRCFGGNPECVTIFGESAGGMSVCNLMASPLARGLFHRGIAQSGFAASVQSTAHAVDVGTALYAALKIPNGDIEALRACSTGDLLAAQQQVLTASRKTRRGMAFRPAIDGFALHEIPLDAICAGRAANVPLLIGTNLDEQRLYMSPRQEFTAAELHDHVTARLQTMGANVAAAVSVIETYRASRPDSEYQNNAAIACAIDTDLSFRIPALRLAHARQRCAVGADAPPASMQAAPLWMYLLTWKSPALRGWLGACHAIDVPFVFGNLDTPGMRRFAGSGAEAEALAQHMMEDWTTFARTGAPAAKDWHAYARPGRQTMLFGKSSNVIAAPYEEERALWASVLIEAL